MTTEKVHKMLDYIKKEMADCTKSDYDKGYKQALENILDTIVDDAPEDFESWPEKPFNDELVPSDWWSGGICENH